ncbi:MAG: hypothetical protein K0S76_1673 [Herbinix sp.]|jgi:hypothetical protein|nr:hypothetical protein [Herbinix sp.]
MILKIKYVFNSLMNKHFKNETITDVVKIIYAYRILSCALTSFAYIVGRPHMYVLFKLGVSISLFILTSIITDYYIKYKEFKGKLKTLLLIETLGLVFLLLPTGGLNSPFIWYSLNPILVAACYLPAYFSWMNLIFYLTSGTIISYCFFNPEDLEVITIFTDNSKLVLIFSLITLAVQLLSGLTKKLYIQTKALELSNRQKQESMNYIMSLYQILEALNNHNTKDKLFEALADYTAKLTKSELCFYWLPGEQSEDGILKVNKGITTSEQKAIQESIPYLNLDTDDLQIQIIHLINKDFMVIPILAPSTPAGLIGILMQNN